MKSFLLNILVFLGLGLCSCGEINVNQTLTHAEQMLQSGDIKSAITSCDILDDTTSVLSSVQMCRIAIIYAKAAEASDNPDFMAAATKYYERALDLDQQADSLVAYIENLSLEDQSCLSIIHEVSRALNSPIDLTDNCAEEDMADLDPQTTASL